MAAPDDIRPPADPNWRDKIDPSGVSAYNNSHPIEHLQAFINADNELLIPTALLRFIERDGHRILQQSFQYIKPDGKTTDQYVWQDVPLVAVK